MKALSRSILQLTALAFAMTMQGCETEYFYEDPPPHVAQATNTLVAAYTSTAPATINAAYWSTADYLPISASNVSIQQLYGDGFLNMNAGFAGLSAFNGGAAPEIKLKAAYDSTNLYILAEWMDSELDASNGTWLYGGPADPRKSDSPAGWTSQRNSDKISFAFDLNAASSPAGTFASKGCAASCHNDGIKNVMFPTSGKVDLWNWSLSHSAPLGYAIDMVAGVDSLSADNGQRMYAPNAIGIGPRSGPAFEWDGTTQSATTGSGTTAILDPGFYLYNKTPFWGDVQRGDSIYHAPAPPGDCESCHGARGEGGTASAINILSQSKKSRSALMSAMDIQPDMVAYWGGLNSKDREDIMAYLRGLSGLPGYYLQQPNGSCADIRALSNVTPVQVANATLPATNKHTKYQVLFIRKLKTNQTDDIQFNPATTKEYKFGVAVMDNDGANHIGSLMETLTFK